MELYHSTKFKLNNLFLDKDLDCGLNHGCNQNGSSFHNQPYWKSQVPIMKIVFVLSKGHHYFYYDRVVRLLRSWGHEIKIVCRAGYSTEGNKSGRALIKLLEDESSIILEHAIF